MDEWRRRLRPIVADWGLSPEDQAEIIEELAQHMQQQFDDLAPRIGRNAAREQVIAHLHEPRLRETRVPPRHRPAIAFTPAGWMSSLARDFRYGWRSLTRNPALTAMGTAALAVGIGLTTLMFSLIYGTLMRGLPVEGSDRIAMIMRRNVEIGPMPIAAHSLAFVRAQQRSFELLGGTRTESVSLSGDDRAERLRGHRVTSDAFAIAGVAPMLGRAFRPGEGAPDAAPVVLLGYDLWRDRYEADSAIVGQVVRIDRQAHTVVGVMPEGFAFPNAGSLWRPLFLHPPGFADDELTDVIGRLRPGVSFAAANAEVQGIASRFQDAEVLDRMEGPITVLPFVKAMIPQQVFSLMYAMFAAVILVFLVACANVANLLLDRAVHRSKEIGVRTALGASRAAIVRQFMIEALMLCALSAVGGAIVAYAGLAAFDAAMVGVDRPSWVEFRMYPQVLPFVIGIAVAASLLSGLLPAILATRSDVNAILKDQSMGTSGRRAQATSRAVVVFEIALSSALLVGAALMTRSVLKLQSVEPGFRTDVLTARVTMEGRDSIQRRLFLERLEQAVAMVPGTEATAILGGVPGTDWSGGWVTTQHSVEPDKPLPVRSLTTTSGFFPTFGVAVARGRPFVEADRGAANPVVIVNQRFVEEHFSGRDPLGQRIRLWSRDRPGAWRTIVGVVPNMYEASMGSPWPSQILVPLPRSRQGDVIIAVRSAGEPLLLAEPLRTSVAAMDPDLPLFEVTRVDAALRDVMWFVEVFGTMFIGFGAAALLLAAVGLYAVMAFSVTRRQREMAIRVTLGAARGDVVRIVGREGAIQIVLGSVIGLALGAAIGRLGRAVLFEVQPTDPLAFAAVLVTLAVTGAAACLVPAIRATRVDPVLTLRSE